MRIFICEFGFSDQYFTMQIPIDYGLVRNQVGSKRTQLFHVYGVPLMLEIALIGDQCLTNEIFLCYSKCNLSDKDFDRV